MYKQCQYNTRMGQFAAPQGLATLSLHFASIILSITVRQRNQALCWNYSATFFNWLFMFYKKNCQNCRMTRRHQSNWYHILRPVHLQKNVAFSSSSSTTLSAKITVVVSTAEWNSCAMHIHVHVVSINEWCYYFDHCILNSAICWA